MPERIMDVHLELDPIQLTKVKDPTRTIAELSRDTAEAQARTVRGTLRHPDPREVVVEQGINATTGRDVMLVATRWVVDV